MCSDLLEGDIPTIIQVCELQDKVDNLQEKLGDIHLNISNSHYYLSEEIKEIKKDIELIKENVTILFKNDKILQNKIIELEKNIKNKIIYSTEIIISTVESIRYAGTHEYQGEEIDCYLVKLEEYNSFFYLYGKYNNFPKIGMNISHKFNGEKIVEWKKLN
jgi:hypothetical protein